MVEDFVQILTWKDTLEHTGDNPMWSRIIDSSSSQKHIKRHTGDKPYKSDILANNLV